MNDNVIKGRGRLVRVHPMAPAHLQRAVFVAVLAFLFFLAMMFAYYAVQSPVFFLLSTAFLVIYLFTMFSLVTQRRARVEIFENGIGYRGRYAAWQDIASVTDDGTITPRTGKAIVVPRSIEQFENVLIHVRRASGAA